MAFVFSDRNIFYLGEMMRIGEIRRLKRIRHATEAEIQAYQAMRRTNLATLVCDNPNCDKEFRVSRAQKLKWNTTNPRRGKFKFKYCSTKCQQEHLIALRKLN